MSFACHKLDFSLILNKSVVSIIIITSLLSVIITSNNSKSRQKNLNEYNKSANRNLQFTDKSIYYNIPFPQNNITGTGDKMKDVPYNALCNILNCESGCCVGEINSLVCGDKILCDEYIDYSRYRVVMPAVIVPIFVVLFFTFMTLIFMKKNNYSFLKSTFLAGLCLFVITIPCVLYYARKKSDYTEINMLINKKR